MIAVWLRLRSEIRSHAGVWLGLALLLGLAGGAATAAAAGARRTETAYPRFVAAQKGYDLLTGGFPESIDPDHALATMEQLPEVQEWARLDAVSYAGILPSGNLLSIPQLAALTDFQQRAGIEFNRFKVLSGRLYDPAAPDEALVDFSTADRYDLRIGSVIRLVIGDFNTPNPQLAPVRIVGIVASPGTFPAVGVSSFFTTVYVTPAFARKNEITPFAGDSSLIIRLRGGAAGLNAFLRDKAKAGLGDVDTPIIEKIQTVGVQRSIRFESQALWALSALIGVTALAILGQSLARQTQLDSAELPTLRAIGMSRRQLFALGLARAAAIGLAGAVVTVPIAVLLSPLTPIGLAKLAEPNPGIWIDGPVLALGSVVVLLLTVGASSLPALGAARSAAGSGGVESEHGRPSALAGALARATSSPAAATGLRLALEPGRGRTAVPVRSAIFGAALSIAALTTSLLFATNLHHVLASPNLSGFTWDAFVAVEENQDATAAALRDDPNVTGYSRGGFIDVKIGGVSLFALVMDDAGAAHPVISEGRAPASDNEIALGIGTMRATHTSIGDAVEVVMDDAESAPVRMRIVGKAIVPPSPFGVSRPGEGAAMSVLGWFRLDPSAKENVAGAPFLVSFASGVSQVDGLASVRRDAPGAFIIPADRPGDVSSLVRIANVPVLLAALLAIMAVGTLAHTLITSIRRRRRDLAILKTLGFARSQLVGVVAWQATTLAVSALLIGLPLGIGLGRWSWRIFADQLGVLPVPVIPVAAILITAPAVLALANLVAALPGRAAARTQAALVLRTE
jgi:ABC-type antimicrobial peptide transport system permease subunit